MRDNPIAIGEADSTVPLNLLPTVKLGTLTTTSGSTQSLTSLDLSPYRFIAAVWNGVSHNGASNRSFLFQSQGVTPTVDGSTPQYGLVIVDVERGQGFAAIGSQNSSTNQVTTLDTSITSATTAISASVNADSFDAGTIEIYGMK